VGGNAGEKQWEKDEKRKGLDSLQICGMSKMG
jgi:hypothetical protein